MKANDNKKFPMRCFRFRDFVGQFFEGDKIPKNYSNIASKDFQVL